MKNKKLVKIIINVILLVSFLLTYFLDLTGLELHQYLGIAAGVLLTIHIIIHAEWIKQVSNRFYKKISWRVRFYYLMDAALLLSIVSITVTGILISTWLTIDVSLYVPIRSIHIISSILGLALLIIKIAFHWKFFARIFRKIHLPKVGQLKVSPVAAPSRGKPAYTRRDALKTIGVITAVGVLGLYKAADAMIIPKVEKILPAPEIHTSEQRKIAAADDKTEEHKELDQESDSEQNKLGGKNHRHNRSESTGSNEGELESVPTQTEIEQVPTALSAQPQVEELVPATDCVVRCPRGCSFPGLCRRYIDENNNQLCDLGECLTL